MPVFDSARGSALESAAARDVLGAKGRCSREEVFSGKDRLGSICFDVSRFDQG